MPKSLEGSEPVLIRDVGAIREGCWRGDFQAGRRGLENGSESQGVTYLGDTWKETPIIPLVDPGVDKAG